MLQPILSGKQFWRIFYARSEYFFYYFFFHIKMQGINVGKLKEEVHSHKLVVSIIHVGYSILVLLIS